MDMKRYYVRVQVLERDESDFNIEDAKPLNTMTAFIPGADKLPGTREDAEKVAGVLNYTISGIIDRFIK